MKGRKTPGFELWQLYKNLFSMFLLERFRAIHKYTQNVHGSNKFLIAPLSWERVVCSAAEGLREKPGEAEENSYLPFITEEREEGGREDVEGKERARKWRDKSVCFFSALLSKERGKLSFLTAGLWNLCAADWLLMPHSCDRFCGRHLRFAAGWLRVIPVVLPQWGCAVSHF